MNRFCITMCMAMGLLICHAQNSKKNQKEFDDFRNEMLADFESFRKEIMCEYIEFLRNPWKDLESVVPIPKPKEKPLPPVVYSNPLKDTIENKNNPIIINDIVTPQPIVPQPEPIVEIPENDYSGEDYVSILFYGIPSKVRFPKEGDYRIKKINEKGVADALAFLSTERYDNTIIDCLNYREKRRLCDWAYLQFIQQIAEKACCKAENESALLAAYILLQSGYKIRFAYTDSRLYLLYASKHRIFNKDFYVLDGENYYSLTELPYHLKVSTTQFPGEQSISLAINKQPLFAQELTPKRTISSKKFSSLKLEVQTNRNLLSFYDTYPCSYYDDNYMTQWALYANTPMDSTITSTMYPVIRNAIKGLTQKESVERLLNLIQTGFDYEFDEKVWGYDRTFFSEESLYYPYCDCEDRSILLTRLIRDLLGLKCILVYYPGHLAAAVNFTDQVVGDYIEVHKQRYVICDPTYIGAPVGETMPGMNNAKAGVILLE